jgi:hypothetical protein
MKRLFHRTSPASVAAILSEGFREGRSKVRPGVWLSDVPLDANDGVPGDALLALDVPDDGLAEFGDYELAYHDYDCRVFLVPPESLNRMTYTLSVIDEYSD